MSRTTPPCRHSSSRRLTSVPFCSSSWHPEHDFHLSELSKSSLCINPSRSSTVHRVSLPVFGTTLRSPSRTTGGCTVPNCLARGFLTGPGGHFLLQSLTLLRLPLVFLFSASPRGAHRIQSVPQWAVAEFFNDTAHRLPRQAGIAGRLVGRRTPDVHSSLSDMTAARVLAYGRP